jgi:dTMP kinase
MSHFIVFEGPDGSGTSSHSHILTDRFRTLNIPILLTAEPSHGTIGTEVRGLLSATSLPSPDSVQLLFCADRADHVATVIQPALENGETVICDRYALSTIVYGGVFGLDTEWLKDINARFPKPDLTIITLPPFEVCQERLGNRDELEEHFENAEFQRRVYDSYSAVEDPSTIFVDTSGDKDAVADEIFGKVQEYFGQVSREEISKL